MKKYCPEKNEWSKCTVQFANVKKSGAFSEHRRYLSEKIDHYIEQAIDPLNNPINLPNLPTEDNGAATTSQPTPTSSPSAAAQPLPTSSPPTRVTPPPAHPARRALLPADRAPSAIVTRSMATQTPTAAPVTGQTQSEAPPPTQPQTTAPPAQTGPSLPELDTHDPIVNRLVENIRASIDKPIQNRQPLRRIFQNQKFRKVLATINGALPRLISREATLTEINQVHYAVAQTVEEEILSKRPARGNGRNQRQQTPPNPYSVHLSAFLGSMSFFAPNYFLKNLT